MNPLLSTMISNGMVKKRSKFPGMDIIVVHKCPTCSKIFELPLYEYNLRMKGSKRKQVFCSMICSKPEWKCKELKSNPKIEQLKHILKRRAPRKGVIAICTCANCGKESELPMSKYNDQIKSRRGKGVCCTKVCSNELYLKRLSASQYGISVLSRGRPGKTMSEKFKDHLSKVRTGKHYPIDLNIIEKEVASLDFSQVATTVGIIPDLIGIVDDKLIAVEVERELYESGIRNKMLNYTTKKSNHGYNEVRLVWYSAQDGSRKKEWILKDKAWTQVEQQLSLTEFVER